MSDSKSEPKSSSLTWQITVTAILAFVGGAVGLIFTYHREIAGWAFPDRSKALVPVSAAEALEAIAGDLERAPADERAGRRYLVLAHLYHPSVGDDERKRGRDAAREAVAWLAPRGKTAALRPLGPQNTVLRLDLAEMGWDEKKWRSVLESYPYGLDQSASPDPKVAAAERRVRKVIAELPYVRADWLAARATQPPLAALGGDKEVPADLKKFAQDYAEQGVGAARLAAEIGVNVDDLRAKIQQEKRLAEKQGLGPLAGDGTVTRSALEDRRFGTSPYQDLAQELKRGTPESH